LLFYVFYGSRCKRHTNITLPAAIKAVAECETAARQQLIVTARGSNIHLTGFNKKPLTMFEVQCVSPHMGFVELLPTNPNTAVPRTECQAER
jgi:hypothetical protein